MARQFELLSVVFALEFVVVATILFVVVPVDVAAPLIPMFLVLLAGLFVNWKQKG